MTLGNPQYSLLSDENAPLRASDVYPFCENGQTALEELFDDIERGNSLNDLPAARSAAIAAVRFIQRVEAATNAAPLTAKILSTLVSYEQIMNLDPDVVFPHEILPIFMSVLLRSWRYRKILRPALDLQYATRNAKLSPEVL